MKNCVRVYSFRLRRRNPTGGFHRSQNNFTIDRAREIGALQLSREFAKLYTVETWFRQDQATPESQRRSLIEESKMMSENEIETCASKLTEMGLDLGSLLVVSD